MPIMNGLDLLDELTSESPHTPVIIFSGALEDADVKEAIAMGAKDYIAKPIKKVNVLMEKIEKALVQAQVEYGKSGASESRESSERYNKYEQELRERKKLEKQIAHAKLEWERTADALSEPIALLDANHRITRVNKSMANVFDSTPKEVVGTKKYLSSNGFDNPEQAQKEQLDLLFRVVPDTEYVLPYVLANVHQVQVSHQTNDNRGYQIQLSLYRNSLDKEMLNARHHIHP
jgi:YesN/AraC family two-component response regulator